MSETLALWDGVCRTDPAFTKPFNRGFRGTATNATYLARKATEIFGPCGIGWGVKVLDERVLDGAEGDKVHRVHIELWYKWQGETGRVEHYGQTMLAGRYKSGPFTDEEAPKKSLTDAMTKALSLLGFAADVHLGLYDDNKYVAELKAEFKAKSEAEEAGAQLPAFVTAPPKASRQAAAEERLPPPLADIDRSANPHQARKKGDWPKMMVDLENYSSCTETLLHWAKTRRERLEQHPWVGEARGEWRKALVRAFGNECHSEAELERWREEVAPKMSLLPAEWQLTASAALEDAKDNLREANRRAAQSVEVLA
jgi:hypothetical protein